MNALPQQSAPQSQAESEIPFFSTHVAPEAIERVTQVLRSTFLNEGEAVREFERKVGAYIGTEFPLAINSCTSALHLALMACGVERDDEVIIPPQTFVATGLVVLHIGAKPVFADIDPTTGNMDAVDVARRITPRTKAIFAVHWGGAPCDMDALFRVAAEHNIPLIDDAAHAFGAEFDGAMIGSPRGSKTRLTCFSFQAIKGLTTGDGGMICANNTEDADRIVQLRWFGIDKRKTKPNDIGERMAALELPGYKYNMNNIAAAIGLGNLVGYAERLAIRRKIDATYRTALAQCEGVTLLQPHPKAKSSCWLFTMRVDRREEFGRAMKGRGIPVTVVDRRIDKHPVFGEGPRDLPNMRAFDENQIAIPLHDALTDQQVSRVIQAVKQGW